MSINYIPNDPLAVGVPTRVITPPTQPTGNVARVSVSGSAREARYQPHTRQFDFWQTQTALIRGLERWRDLDGALLRRWFGNRQTLPILTNAGDDLNAFYDRRSLQFFSHTFQGRTVHSCESVDIVTHEQGHALLDAVRRDFFDAPFVEAAAFHESFGDCYAVMVALADSGLRTAALAASPDLSSQQFLSQLAEELGDAIRREFGPVSVEPGALRRALNTFQYADPATLPANAPASQLSREPHNFSRVFTGCFYDVIRNVFNAGPRTAARLGTVATTVGKIWIAAVRSVPLTAKVFEGVGRRMLQVDLTQNGGANATHIQNAFRAHNIGLGGVSTSVPTPLDAPARVAASRALAMSLGVRKSGKLDMNFVDSPTHGEIAHVSAYQPLKLTGALDGLAIMVPATARVAVHGRSIVGMLGDIQPITETVEQDAAMFAQTLAANGQIEGLGARQRRTHQRPTHEVQSVRGRKLIVRRRFTCGPACWQYLKPEA